MVKLMNIDQLVKIAAGAGIILEPATPENENLYVYATDDNDEHTVYVGKSASKARHATETNVENQDYRDRIGVGFSALVKENNAKRHSFRYDPAAFDPSLLTAHIEEYGWNGTAITKLVEKLDVHADHSPALSVEDIEKALVRIHVNTGRLIGNSQFASQWEATVNGAPNVVAVLAADIARQNGTLPNDTEVATTPAIDAPDEPE